MIFASKQQMSELPMHTGRFVRDPVHPAGMKMFGTKVSESSANVPISDYSF